VIYLTAVNKPKNMGGGQRNYEQTKNRVLSITNNDRRIARL